MQIQQMYCENESYSHKIITSSSENSRPREVTYSLVLLSCAHTSCRPTRWVLSIGQGRSIIPQNDQRSCMPHASHSGLDGDMGYLVGETSRLLPKRGERLTIFFKTVFTYNLLYLFYWIQVLNLPYFNTSKFNLKLILIHVTPKMYLLWVG